MVPVCQGLPRLDWLRLHGLVTILTSFHPLGLGILFHTPALLRLPFWSLSLFEGRLVFRKTPSSLHVSFKQGPDLFNRVWIKPHAQSFCPSKSPYNLRWMLLQRNSRFSYKVLSFQSLPRTGNEPGFPAPSLLGLKLKAACASPSHTLQSFGNRYGCLISEEMASLFRVCDLICSLGMNWTRSPGFIFLALAI